MGEKERAKGIIRRLERVFDIDPEEFIALKAYLERKDPFGSLVATIISQNTSERNSFKAWNNLKSKINIDPFTIAKIDPKVIAELIRPAGLQDQKARAIVSAAKFIAENFNGDMKKLLSLPVEEARRILVENIPGVGWKTADVVLSMYGKPTIGVDTHISRVSLRLGFTKTRRYEEVRRKLMELYDPDEYYKVHLLLILLGRRYCKARNPLCNQCPVKDLCPRHGIT